MHCLFLIVSPMQRVEMGTDSVVRRVFPISERAATSDPPASWYPSIA